MKKSLVLLSMLVLSVSAFSAKPTLPKSYTVRYTHNFGRIDGFVQIPNVGLLSEVVLNCPPFGIWTKPSILPKLWVYLTV